MGVYFKVPSKKQYSQVNIHTLIRKSYYEELKNMNVTIVDFIDKALGDKLQSYKKDDEFHIKKIQEFERRIKEHKNLMNINQEEKEILKIKEIEIKEKYKKFCHWLNNYTYYKTKDINEEYGTCVKDFEHFNQIKDKYNNGGFSIEEFKRLRKGL